MARAPKPISEGTARGQQPLQIRRDRKPVRVRLVFRRRHSVESLLTKAVGDAEGAFEDAAAERPKLDPFINHPPPKSDKPVMKVRFSVSFRCHSRQLLCMGGSQFPFGWSFVSIAKLPMTWNPVDRWTAEVMQSCVDRSLNLCFQVYLPLGMRLEYKYVILEEQVWTNQQDEDAEGVVEVTYRSGDVPGQPPDVQKIRKQMAIVDWQPGPNRVIQIPDQDEIDRLIPGEKIQRTPARPRSYFSFRKLDSHPQKTSMDGTWEELSLDAKGEPVLNRRDIWPNRGTSLSFEDARRFFLGE